MIRDRNELLERFADLRVLVVGDVMLDRYIHGSCHRLCPEAPAPVVSVETTVDAPGGAANCAVNLSALGAKTALVGLTGEDCDGELLRQRLAAVGVDVDSLLASELRRTSVKQRVVADNQLLVRFDTAPNCEPSSRDVRRMNERIAAHFDQCDAIVISDYGAGVCSQGMIAELLRLRKRRPVVLACDSKRLREFRRLQPTIVKPNYAQAAALLDRPLLTGPERIPQIAAQAEKLLELTNARIVAATLDSDGSLLFERDRDSQRLLAPRVEGGNASGAGDAYIAALTLAVATGADVRDAGELATAAAAVAVASRSTAVCSLDELRCPSTAASTIIRDRSALRKCADDHRRSGRRIVLTNGCFDVLHSGHISYLRQAKEQGAVLFVGVNADATVRKLKGRDRPINCLEDRMQVLAALGCVDHVAPFDEDDPRQLIRCIRPDVFVKGGDYTLESLPEAPVVAELGGVVMIMPLVADRSTTRIIQTIRQRPEVRVAGAPSTN